MIEELIKTGVVHMVGKNHEATVAEHTESDVWLIPELTVYKGRQIYFTWKGHWYRLGASYENALGVLCLAKQIAKEIKDHEMEGEIHKAGQ